MNIKNQLIIASLLSATVVLGGCDLLRKEDEIEKAARKKVAEIVAKDLAERAARDAELDKEYQRYIEQCQREGIPTLYRAMSTGRTS
ncbi:MAG: hypothetical protein EU981_04680 [Candidatus Liberibacter ctenarytainae]|uniref:Lipoprotein n=1 Tax=Candidatus Liberibacter ctenarytainae TaxID=2020335 RepID=A0A937AM89_9HYPH|nr:hypothetical protein [Candidatus Liberibacter ctenarytainae]MBL0849349.1 hypothetical protein [Candidatus Liberibacter ctenarytainae]